MDERDYKAMNKDAQKDVKTMEAKKVLLNRIYEYSIIDNELDNVILAMEEYVNIKTQQLQIDLKEARERELKQKQFIIDNGLKDKYNIEVLNKMKFCITCKKQIETHHKECFECFNNTLGF